MNGCLAGRPGLPTLVAALVTAGILAVALAFAAANDPSLSRAAPLTMMTDFSGTNDRAEFAQYPEVFIGTIGAEIGEHNISEAGAAVMVPLFVVDVDRTIFGRASGQVNVAVFKDEFTAELPGDEVVAGGRYLFASDVPDDAGAYYVTEGFEAIAVRSDAAADALEAEFRRLREEGPALAEQDFPPADPCEAVIGRPRIDIEPNVTKAGRELTVTIENAVRPEVGIYWRNFRHPIGRGRVAEDCTSEAVVRVPGSAQPGVYRVVVTDARVLRAVERVVVTGRGERKVRERSQESDSGHHAWLSVVEPGWWAAFRLRS